MLIRNIAYLMAIHGLKSATKLAEILDIPQSTLHRLTSGEVEDPKYFTLKTIGDYFGRTPAELMECDLSEIDGDRPYIHTTDDAPESKFQALPEDVRQAAIEAYKEIVIREARIPEIKYGELEKYAEIQTARLENLAENLVNGFSKLIES
ncbi:transcriptional regulator [Xenorhabdus mauleonii]|uniref:Transcriptional regulator n=1 Tax=Xenorhabdus mauleonii TaxID=351675 RepID=A0A1I3WMI6_9GAMM|nr:helix-turn-helix transcriptional regulator [Xenorhabdus mauleonii]PHM39292.1 transcriptional regulator [Xenorhabdus mauleonii]SFK08695.1 DNA-binding transcriptional regulator, XRE family [Xenorhabdus mauleonii]